MAEIYPPLPAGFEIIEEQTTAPAPAAAAPPGASAMAPPAPAGASSVPPLPAGFELLPDDYGADRSIDVAIDGGALQPAQTAAPQQPAGPYAGSMFNQLVNLFSGPTPLQGDTPEARKADYQSRSPALRATVGVGQFIDSNVQGISQLTGGQTPQMADKGAFSGGVTEGDTVTDAARIGSEIAAWAVPFSKVAKIPSLAGRMAASGALGGGIGAIQEADSNADRVQQAAFGAAGGAGGEAFGTGLRAVAGRVTPEIGALYNSAKKFGIELSPAQLSNSSFVKRAENMLRNMPFTGASRAWEKQLEQFNRAVSREFGEDAPKITPDVFAAAKSRVGREFDELSARSNLTITDDLLNRLSAVQDEAAAFSDPAVVNAVGSAVDRILRQSKDGVLPGPAYKSLDSQLGKITAAGGEKAIYVGEVRDAIREAMDASIAPEMKQAWQQARGQYRALKTVEPLVANSADGTISPAQLMGRVTANKAGKSQMASGRAGNLGELARIGQAMKPPSSAGTAENMLAGGIFNPVNWPAYAAGGTVGAVGGRALNSNALSRLMADPVTRPAVVNQLSRLMAPSGALAAPAVAAPLVAEPRRRNDGR